MDVLRANPNIRSFGQRINEGLGRGIQEFEQYQKMAEENAKQQKFEDYARNALGIEVSGLPMNEAARFAMQAYGQQQKFGQEQQYEREDYAKIKDQFGEKFADIWKASPTGARTELLKAGLDAKLRGKEIDEIFSKSGINEIEPAEEDKKPKISKQKKIDFTKPPEGITPKEWAAEKKTWRSENAPIFAETTKRLKAADTTGLAIKKLNKLNESKKLPEGLEKFLINPDTGEFYGLAQLAGKVSPETQEWVKEIARFQNRAKDTFGSRVTNFDLITYMKQFPSLMNTEEGRRRILRMMEINNEMDQLYDKSLKKTYQEYGLNGIPQEEADKLAQEEIDEKINKLHLEYLGLNEENEMQGNENQELSGRMIEVIGPDGELYELDESELDQLPEGYRIL